MASLGADEVSKLAGPETALSSPGGWAQLSPPLPALRPPGYSGDREQIAVQLEGRVLSRLEDGPLQ